MTLDADIMAAAMTQFPSDEWLEGIRAADVAVELIAPLGDLLRHEQTEANGFVVEVDDPVWGPTRQAAPPFGTDPPMRVRWPAPRLGEHADELAALIAGRTDDSGAPAGDGKGHVPAGDGKGHVPAGDGKGRTWPFEGLHVLDLGAFLAGPMGPMLLGDLGAAVIKVEPVTGDPVRGWRDEFYIACNRSKRGIALDITQPEGTEVLRRLVEWADVVHHNVRSKASARLGIDEAGVRAVNPDAVFCHGTAYGTAGPRAAWPGYDSVFQAMSGWNVELAGEGNGPLFNHMGNLDTMTGTASAVATLLALYQRERTGRASAAHFALLNTATFSKQ